MPINYHIKPNDNIVVIVHVGAVPDDEFLAFYKTFYRDRVVDDSFNLVVDLRRAESYERTSVALKGVVNIMQGYYLNSTKRPKIAVVAPDDLSFGLARMFEAFSTPVPFEFKVFKTADTGLDWLDAPSNLLDDLEI